MSLSQTSDLVACRVYCFDFCFGRFTSACRRLQIPERMRDFPAPKLARLFSRALVDVPMRASSLRQRQPQHIIMAYVETCVENNRASNNAEHDYSSSFVVHFHSSCCASFRCPHLFIINQSRDLWVLISTGRQSLSLLPLLLCHPKPRPNLLAETSLLL